VARGALRLLAGLAVLAVLAAAALAAYGVTGPDPDPAALAAARADPAVTVEERDGYLAILPAGGPPARGLVFYPGARIAPGAYAATWAPIVARTGTAVFVPAMPFRWAFLAPGRGADVIAAEPAIREWWAGGHSLGGAIAGSWAGGDGAPDLRGLVLWGAYVTEGAGLAGRDDLAVLSVSGSRDGLSTPAEVAARRDLLPPDATVVEIPGMNHAQFGRYGPQEGDLAPTIDDEEARRRLTEAVAGFLLARGLAAHTGGLAAHTG